VGVWGALLGCAALALVMPGCKSDEEILGPVALEPTFSSIQSNVFNTSCASSLCHGTAAGTLTLTPGNSFAQLVNVRSAADGDHAPKFFRVLPGQPDSSFLVIKITHPSGAQGELMPPGLPPLTQNQLNAIRTWITNGAPNN